MMQRIIDFILSVIGLLLLSPIFIVVALAVKFHDRGPVFYRARRVGRGGREFDLYKFRTMIPDAHKLGIGLTAPADDRITPLGRQLRRFKLDEFPQLINVVTGDMALVGPRPEDPRFVAFFSEEEKEILKYRPGITSPVSLHLRNEEELFVGNDWVKEYVERVLPHKLRTELAYLRERTLLSDIKVVLKTVLAILFMNRKFYAHVLRIRNRHILLVDVFFAFLIPFLGAFLRLETLQDVLHYTWPLLVYGFLALVWKLSIFFPAGLYNRYWRYASVHEVWVLAIATTFSWATGIIIYFGLIRPLGLVPPDLPRSIPFVDGGLTMIEIGAVRYLLRIAYDIHERLKSTTLRKRALIAGAGVAGSMIVKEMRTNPHLGLEPIGFLDDDTYKRGQLIHGVPVVGAIKDLENILKVLRVDEVVIAMPRAPGKVIRQIIQTTKDQNIPSKTVPGIFEILGGSATVSDLRDVKIEDLLRRGVNMVKSKEVAELIANKRIVVTGAGGSIGGELCRQVLVFKPAELVLLGHGEHSIFQIAGDLVRQLERSGNGVQIHTVIADIRDRERLDLLFQIHRPQIIFHAAAHKHVGLMEANLPDAITNNVLGTQILVELSALHKVDRFVMISSDKAVKPTNIMGATKRVAELIVRDAARRTGGAYMSVRFGNVLGSRGSVVPILQQQIAEGGPVCVSHPDATRYFMTIPEAAHLVCEAAAMGSGGEIFVLDMGAPIRILDLARDMIRMSGLVEGHDIDIKFAGLKRGEKISEELFYPHEAPVGSANERILVHKDETQRTFAASGGWEGESTLFLGQVKKLIEAGERGDLKQVESLMERIEPNCGMLDGAQRVGEGPPGFRKRST